MILLVYSLSLSRFFFSESLRLQPKKSGSSLFLFARGHALLGKGVM